MRAFLAGLLTGVLSGCGIGGGSLLVLWLTLFEGMPQFTAGGINLLYFLACAPAALVSHVKNRLIDRSRGGAPRLAHRRFPAAAAVRRTAARHRREGIVYKTEKYGNQTGTCLV